MVFNELPTKMPSSQNHIPPLCEYDVDLSPERHCRYSPFSMGKHSQSQRLDIRDTRFVFKILVTHQVLPYGQVSEKSWIFVLNSQVVS